MKKSLHWQVVIAIGLAVLAGAVTQSFPPGPAEAALRVYDFIGSLFLQALKLLIVPLIVSAIISGVGGIGSGKGLGRLAAKTVLYYAVTSMMAIVVGLTVVNLVAPGRSGGEPVGSKLGLPQDGAVEAVRIARKDSSQLVDVILRMVPPNIIAAAAEGQMLGLIVFSLLFGIFMTKVRGPNVDILLGFWRGLFDVMMRITEWLLLFLPIGVFGLVAAVAAKTGVNAVKPLALFLVSVILSLGIHFFLVLPTLLVILGKTDPFRHVRAMAPALVTAFSTSSSSAALPATLECLNERTALSERTTSFVVPLGATVNMDGTALYECAAAIFIAQAYGIDLGFGAQFLIVVLALLTSIGVAGIPAASLVAILIILDAVGLPAEGIGLILAVDRPLDMLRTGVNVFSDTCGAVIIGRSEGEIPYRKENVTSSHPPAG